MLDFSEGATPLYSQVVSDICKRISEGRFAIGAYLPSQYTLCEEYGVSRITIIKAMEMLREKGIVESQQGKGYRVVKQNINTDSYIVDGFSAQFKKKGFVTSTKVISANEVEASSIVAKGLMVFEGEKVIELKRVRLIKDIPICFECTYYRDTDVLRRICLNIKDNESLYSLLRTNGFEIAFAEESMSAVMSSEYISKLRHLEHNSTILKITRKTYFSSDNLPFEFCINHYNTEEYGEYGIVTINFQSHKEDS